MTTGQGGSEKPERLEPAELQILSPSGFETPQQEAIEERQPVEPRAGLWRDVLDELRWTWAGRKVWLFQFVLNAAEAVGYLIITDYDPHVAGDIKHANIGLQVVLYCMASQINTNQLGNDGERVLGSLKAGDSVRRILAIKNLALALILYPLALLVTLTHEMIAGRYHLFFHAAMVDLGAVFLWLGVGSVVSVVVSYPPIRFVSVSRTWPPIRLGPRIRAILARKGIVRYAVAQVAPYALWYGIVSVLHLPYKAIWDNHLLGPRLTGFPIYSFVYVGIGLGYWLAGLWLAGVYDRRYPERVMRDLQREL